MNPLMQQLPLWAEIVIAMLLVVGAAFALVGSWTMVKWSDLLRRLHGPSKATTLGVGCLLIGSTLCSPVLGDPSLDEFLISLCLFTTAPVSAHLLMKAAMRLDPAQRPIEPGKPGHQIASIPHESGAGADAMPGAQPETEPLRASP